MSTTDPRHYDILISPVVTEKATTASEHNKIVFKVARTATKPQIKEAVEKLFDVKVKSVNTLIRKGKVRVFKGRPGELQNTKRAVGDLEEAHRIGVTTGLAGEETNMALKTYKPTTPSQRGLVIVDRSALHSGKPVKSLVEGQNSTGGRRKHRPNTTPRHRARH